MYRQYNKFSYKIPANKDHLTPLYGNNEHQTFCYTIEIILIIYWVSLVEYAKEESWEWM